MNVSSSHFIIGDFIVENKKIGKGNFATVHKGIHKYTKQKVAIKKLDVENVYDLKKHVKREIKLHKELDHPNVVKLFDVLFDNSNHVIYFVMELCKYGNFAKFQNKRPMTEYYIHKYTKQLTNGLEYLYKNDIIHRDLKPQNLLLCENKYLKISDFGFAKSLQNVNNDNLKQTYCGSPMYMAPEILHYQHYNEKSDLWSVGIIIYEMITGNPPYRVKNFYQLVKKMNTFSFKLENKYASYISPELKDLLSKLLVKNPDKRISWTDYFNHEFILKDLQLERDNKLIELSITDSSSLPTLNFKHKTTDKIFNSFNTNTNNNSHNLDLNLNLNFNLYSSQKIKNNYSDNNSKNNSENFDKKIIKDSRIIPKKVLDDKNNDDDDKDEDEDELFFSIMNEDELFKNKNSDDINDDINDDIIDNDINDNDINNIQDSKESSINISNISSEEESYILLSNNKNYIKSKPIDIPKRINNNNVNNFSIYNNKFKNSFEIRKEIMEAINSQSYDNNNELSFELKTSNNNETIIYKTEMKNNKNNTNNKNKMFKNVFKNSMMILKESYDYLSSKNKSI